MPDLPFTPAPERPANPLAQMGQNMDFVRNAQEVQRKNMEMVGHQVAGQYMQQSINPETGEPDYNKFLVSLSRDPRTAFVAPEMIGVALQQKKTSLEVLQQHMMNANLELETLGNQMQPLVGMLGEGKKVEWGDVASAMAGLQRNGIFKDSGAATQAYLALKQRFPNDPGAAVRSLAQYSNNGKAALGNTMLTMEKLVAQQEYLDPNGYIRRGTVGGFVNPRRAEAAPGAPMELPGAAPANEPAGGQAPPPAAGRTGQQPSSAGQSAPDQSVVGMGPGLHESVSGRVHNFQDEMKILAGSLRSAVFSDQQIGKIYEASKGFTPGPGETVFSSVGKLAEAAGLPDLARDIAGGDISKVQEFEKYTVRNSMDTLQQALAGSGHITDDKYKTFVSGNVNLDTKPEAIRKLLAFQSKVNRVVMLKHWYMTKYQEKHVGHENWNAAEQGFLQYALHTKDPKTGENYITNADIDLVNPKEEKK